MRRKIFTNRNYSLNIFEFFDSKFEFYALFNFATDESLNDQNSASNYCNLWQTFLAQLQTTSSYKFPKMLNFFNVDTIFTKK